MVTFRFKKAFISGAFFVAFTPQVSAWPVVCVNCSTEWTQIMNNIQLVTSQIELVRQTINQVKMIEDQIKNSKNITSGEWGDISSQLQKINSIARYGEGIAFSSADFIDDMNRVFKGYDSWEREVSPLELNDHYRQISRSLGDTAIASMSVANEISNQQQEDKLILDRQQNASESAAGRLQAIQAGNQLTGQVVTQLQKIETLLSTQIQLTTMLVQAENERTQIKKAQTDRFMKGDYTKLSDRQLEPFKLKQF